MHAHTRAQSLSHVQLFETPLNVAHQAPVSMGFLKQEFWGGLPFPTPGDFPPPKNQTPVSLSPALAGRFFTTVLPGKVIYLFTGSQNFKWYCHFTKDVLPHPGFSGNTSCFSQAQRHHAYLKPLNSKFRTIKMLTFTPPSKFWQTPTTSRESWKLLMKGLQKQQLWAEHKTTDWHFRLKKYYILFGKILEIIMKT